MCGRYALYRDTRKIPDYYGVENSPPITPGYNIAPMVHVPVIIRTRIGFARWGLLPPFAGEDDPPLCAKMINARSETVRDKPSFRPAWEKGRRCIVPADGFYEWEKHEDGRKQPHFIHGSGGGLLSFAGLWWRHPGLGPEGGDLVTFTILTTQAGPEIAPLHPRMPVIIDPADISAWLEGPLHEAAGCIERAGSAHLKYYPVSREVNKAGNDGPGLLEPVES